MFVHCLKHAPCFFPGENKRFVSVLHQEGLELTESKPEFEPVVTERLAKLHELWDQLESTTQQKARLLFDANRSELFDQSLADMKKWLAELQQQLQGGDEDVRDLTNANILLKKHQVCKRPTTRRTVYRRKPVKMSPNRLKL